MSLSRRLKTLEAAAPRCDPRALRLAPEGYAPTEADRCRHCGGCHVVVIEEVIIETPEEAERWRRENGQADAT